MSIIIIIFEIPPPGNRKSALTGLLSAMPPEVCPDRAPVRPSDGPDRLTSPPAFVIHYPLETCTKT